MAKLTKYKDLKPLIKDRWFSLYELPNDIYAIFEPYHFQEVAAFLVIGSEKALLFDTGMGVDNIRELVEKVTELPVTVVNSHSHFDHIGGDCLFDEVHMMHAPDIEGSASSWQAARAAGDENLLPEAFEKFPGGFDALWFDPASLETLPPKKVIPITEGEIFDLGDVSLRVIATPGHSEDGIMLVDDERKLILTGDTIYPAPLYAHLGESNLAVYTRVAHELADRYSDYLMYCSHNDPVWEGSALKEIAAAFDEVSEKIAAEKAEGKDHEISSYAYENFSIIA